MQSTGGMCVLQCPVHHLTNGRCAVSVQYAMPCALMSNVAYSYCARDHHFILLTVVYAVNITNCGVGVYIGANHSLARLIALMGGGGLLQSVLIR